MADGKEGLGFRTLLMIGILMIIIAAGTSYAFMTFFADGGEAQVSTVNKEIGPTYSLGDFVVNLSGSGGYQFIQASIVVEVDSEKVVSELDRRSPQIRDIIISILRDQKLEDIEEPGAKIIKNQIRFNINKVLSTGEIKNVWFTQLVVQ